MFTPCSSVSIVNFEHAIAGWVEVFLEISQNSQENTCTRVSFLIKFQASGDFL